jgi:N-acetylmuramoyl-L-alanine amidase
MLHDQLRAWHAGAGKWGQVTDVNSLSIGIELDNDGLAPYREAQLQVLLTLLDTLKQRYRIPAANFIGHADIAPGRKVDPGINFSWERLAKKGFGLWYGDTLSLILPESFDARTALKIIGYDVHDQTAAIQSFRLHFMASQRKGELLQEEKKILYALQLKSME